MSCGIAAVTWAGVECPEKAFPAWHDHSTSRPAGAGSVVEATEDDIPSFLGEPTDDRLTCATDPFDDFDDDEFDDEFDDDFEEEWDEELPGDADQFEADKVAETDDDEPGDGDFEDDE